MVAIVELSKQIVQAKTAAECESLEAALKKLLNQVSSKKKEFEESDRKRGLEFKGKNAFVCDCGNTVKEHGEYIGSCEECNEAFCTDCLADCDSCGNTFCNCYERESKRAVC